MTSSNLFKQLDAAMQSMNLEKITATMDQFEKSFEGIDLVTSTMEGAMVDAMATSAPSGQVDALIQQVINQLDGTELTPLFRLPTKIIYKFKTKWQAPPLAVAGLIIILNPI